MLGFFIWVSLAPRAQAGWWQSFCEQYIVADAPVSVMYEEAPLHDVGTEDLVRRYRVEGGRALWRRQPSQDLAHLGYILRLRTDAQPEIAQAIEDYGDWERWPRTTTKRRVTNGSEL